MQSTEQLGEQLHSILFNSKKRAQEMVTFTLSLDRNQRIAVRKYYDSAYPQKGLIEDLKKKLGGDFEDLVVKLYLTREELDVEQLERAMGTLTSDEAAIYEIIFSRPLAFRQQIKEYYQQKTGKSLENELPKSLSNPVKKIIKIFLNSDRRPNGSADPGKCQQDAKTLADTKNWIENQQILTNIFATDSPDELVLTSRYYNKIKGVHISKTIESFSKTTKTFFEYLFLFVINPAEGFARKLNESVTGLGTDTNMLERIVVSRNDVDMSNIKKYYKALYDVTLKEDIADDVSGDYKALVLPLLNIQNTEDF